MISRFLRHPLGIIGLVLVGIPVAWQSLFVGVFLLLGVCVPAIRERSIQRKRGLVVFE